MTFDQQSRFDEILSYVVGTIVGVIISYCLLMLVWEGFLSPHAQACREVYAIPYDDGTCRRIEEVIVKP